MNRNSKYTHSILKAFKFLLLTVCVGTVIFSLYIQNAKTEKSAERTAHKFLVSLNDASPNTLNNILPSMAGYSDTDAYFKLYIKHLNLAIRKRFGNCYTDEFWNYMIGNRIWLTAPEAAQHCAGHINVKSIEFKKIDSDKKEIHLNFEVEMEMEMSMIKENEIISEPISQKGEVWLVFDGLGYKISQLIYTENQLVQFTY